MYNEQMRHFKAIGGTKALQESINAMGEDSPLTCLIPDLTGIDPDDAFSIVPYEKGCLFLYYLEEKVGGNEHLLSWINDLYFTYQRKSISAHILKESFLNFFSGKVDPKVLSSIDWDTWFNGEGMPPFDPSESYKNKYSISCEKVIEKWLNSTDGSEFSKNDLEGFKPSQIMFCLDEIASSNRMPIHHKVLEKMNEIYQFFGSTNVEISNRFIGISLRSKYPPAVSVASEFLSKHGRGRYVKYLYNCLNEYDHQEAVRVWRDNHMRYHSVIYNAFVNKLAS